ncbi:MAG TPA: DNA translocase FtsK 4TM domain-containing protein [Hypericibacter adhaerens]|jgi:S-DNA-T family DNA segregation ATPase FtsK/SpoIIIE|uniref:DNA translocase FtsK n=1 Tax=Hypericibacter adhaerens TaxID=2602016 RepID=A0A5J6N5H3_9PROT|nr:DNA translocase FtsK 4TM domain-containing protein [Hypericibacter adhaerens]QEX25158.1 DNA translocase FtsK [Hypericibacter adhaerens]HWA42028.1 DNA translocase FtsK 4TM domain-containing protein [Hypericibacter adhaerens]
MTDETSGLMRMPFLPDDWRLFLRRRAIEAGGLALLLLAGALLLALMSYNAGDPSLNTATGSTVRNLMGYPGSVAADLLLQALGIASLMLVLVPAVWGWRVLRHRISGLWWLRLLLLPFAILFLAMALAALGPTSSWFLPVGLGGYAGDVLLPRLAGLVSLPPAVMAILGFLLWAGLGYLALGISARGYVTAWQRLQQAGELVARLTASLRRRFKPEEVEAEAAEWRAEQAERQRRQRVEPHLGAGDEAEEDEGEPVHAPLARQPERPEAAPRIEAPKARPKPGKRAERDRQATLDLVDEEYTLPPLELLAKPPSNATAQKMSEAALEQNARLLESVLQDFGVKGQIVKVRPGPVVTLYELEPAPGTKTSRVVGLADDIARSMSAVSVRVAVVPGRSVIGIELPNQIRETVMLRELLACEAYERTAAKLALVLGKDIGGQPVIVDLARMPHLLIAGTTGSGKSVAINTMILSLLYRLTPDACKFIMIDPKMLELSVYDGIPHLLTPVVTEPRKAIVALKWVVRAMEDRYRLMSKLGVRNIEGYNLRVADAAAKEEKLSRKVQTGFDPETGQPIYEEEEIPLEPLPFIVVVVDEMADLMLVAGKDIEAAIQRLAQMARAAGIHIIMATQRPSVDVITGTIKANFPTRVSFHVTSKIDSRTILGETGAEQLLGQGDMLYMAQGGRITRVHGPFVADQEVESIVRFLKKQGEPTYIEEVTQDEEADASDALGGGGESEGGDALYDQAVAIVCRERKASVSFVQRHLQIGYNRAARIVERMEREGVVSTANHVGKREVLARNIDGDT